MNKENIDIEHFIDLYGRDILRFIRFYTKNSHDAEDLTQEVFLRAYKNWSTFRNECNQKTWLLQIALNVCRNFYRWNKRHPQVLVDTIPSGQLSPSPEVEVCKKTEEQDLMKQICDLPIKLKEVVLLHYFEDKPTLEIAKMLGVRESAVRVRLFRARNLLKLWKEVKSNADYTESLHHGGLAPNR